MKAQRLFLKLLRTMTSTVDLNYRRWTSSQRALPHFVIIGANDSGTTSFFVNLVKHPSIAIATSIKEIHYFDRHYALGESWYRSHFPYKRQLAAKKQITGEATPAYLFSPFIPERAAKLLTQDTKFIALLRNPVARAYGHYNHQVAKQRQNLSFNEVIEIELEAAPKYSDYATAVENRTTAGYLLYGMYAEQLRNWFKHFPRENFTILKSETYFQNPNHLIEQTAVDVLGLPGWQFPEYTRTNQGRKYAPMDAKIASTLESFYKPYNQALYQLLGQDFGWD